MYGGVPEHVRDTVERQRHEEVDVHTDAVLTDQLPKPEPDETTLLLFPKGGHNNNDKCIRSSILVVCQHWATDATSTNAVVFTYSLRSIWLSQAQMMTLTT